ncbi:MAG: nitroreductase family protein [Reyranellaceae bacterium]
MAISRRNFIRVVGGVGIVAAGGVGLRSCDAMPESAVSAWSGPTNETDLRRRVLAWAQLAPNPHNRQAWLVALPGENEIVLYCDRNRLLPHTDPFSRQIMIGHGCFLELLVQAAAAEKHRAEIALFPQGGFPVGEVGSVPVARIRLAPDPAIAADPLFAHVRARRSAKVPFDTDRPVPDAAIAALVAAVGGAAGARVRFGETRASAARQALRDLTEQAMTLEMKTPRTMAESIDLMRLSAAEIDWYRDGISLHGPLFWWGQRLGFIDRKTMADPASNAFASGIERYKAMTQSGMGFAWLITAGNERTDQIAAGRAHARLNLAATAAGVALQPLSQALQEYPEMAPLYSQLRQAVGAGEGETVQMLVRLGYAGDVPPAPRRRLDDLLVTGAA